MTDEELDTLLKIKSQEKWLEIFMILCQLEDKLKKPITYFKYTPYELYVKEDEGIFIRISLI